MEAATATEGGATQGIEAPVPEKQPKPQEPSKPEELPKAAQKPPEKKRYKVKISGEEREVDEDELVRNYQLAQASNQRFEQASKMYKEVQPLLSAKEKGDLDTLLDGVPDDARREWAEKYLGEWLKLQEMDPRERENLEYKKKLEQYEKQEQERKQKEETAREQHVRQQLAQHARSEIENELADVLTDIPQEKRSPRLVARIAEEMLTHFQAGKGRLPAKTAYERARTNLEADVTDLLGGMDGEQLVTYLPKEVVNKVLKYHADKVKSQSPFGVRKASTPQQPRGKQNRMATDDYFAKLDEKFR